MRPALLALAFLVTACGRAGLRVQPGEKGEVVETEGWAALGGADELGAERRALTDAQRKAVEKVAGVFIAAKTRVDQAASVDERLLANVSGYVRRYEVLGRRREGGFLKVRIRAVVLYEKVGDDAKRLGLDRPAPPPGNPRVAVELPGPAGQGLRAALAARGFTLVDAGAQEGDLIVRGTAAAEPVRDERLGGLSSQRARVSARVLKAKSGEVAADATQEASAVDASAEGAADKALAKAGALAGEALLKDLAPALKSRIGVAVSVSGVADLAQVRALLDEIRLNPEVEAATLSSFEPGSAKLQVTTRGLAGEELGALLQRSRKFRLLPVSVTTYSVELRAQ